MKIDSIFIAPSHICYFSNTINNRGTMIYLDTGKIITVRESIESVTLIIGNILDATNEQEYDLGRSKRSNK